MRYLTPEITRSFAEETKMAFIAGPRQVGKTTLAKHLLSEVGMEASISIGILKVIGRPLSKTLKISGKEQTAFFSAEASHRSG